MKISAFVLSVLIISVLSCTSDTSDQSDHTLPPAELLQSNYQIAEQVCSVTLQKFYAQDTLYDDSGQPGYLRYRFFSTTDQVYKGKFSPGDSISFTYVVEFSPPIEKYFQSSHIFLVYLKKEADSQNLRVIEAGMFALTEQLRKYINNLF